jgi:hypothetical protein
MRCTVLRVVPLIVGLQHADLLAQEIQLRAGTLLDCTLQEPSFSSHSAKVGEPVNCQGRPLRQFGREAIPHGAFSLVGSRVTATWGAFSAKVGSSWSLAV